MNNPEQIIAGWKIGFLARYYYNGNDDSPADWDYWTVVSIAPKYDVDTGEEIGKEIYFRSERTGYVFEAEEWHMEELKGFGESDLDSFIYGGQLAGSEPIPEGQKFRVKETGEIWECDFIDKEYPDTIFLKSDGFARKEYDKSELEPVFTS